MAVPVAEGFVTVFFDLVLRLPYPIGSPRSALRGENPGGRSPSCDSWYQKQYKMFRAELMSRFIMFLQRSQVKTPCRLLFSPGT